MTENRIILINFVQFLIGWTIIFRLGADEVLPDGFWKIIVLILILDLLQCLFLKFVYLKRPSLLLAAFVFSFGMALTALLVRGFVIDWIWEMVCASAGLAYSLFFYLLNRFLLKLIPGQA